MFATRVPASVPESTSQQSGGSASKKRSKPRKKPEGGDEEGKPRARSRSKTKVRGRRFAAKSFFCHRFKLRRLRFRADETPAPDITFVSALPCFDKVLREGRCACARRCFSITNEAVA